MEKFEFVSGNEELLDMVQPLWEKLNKHHEVTSNYFSNNFRSLNFEVRKHKFINDKALELRIDLVKDIEMDIFIGYCISTINKDFIGEIDSLFIDVKYRKYGLGDQLMNMALDWLNTNKVKTKIISVAEGNEDVIEFYKKYGFCTRRITLEQINN